MKNLTSLLKYKDLFWQLIAKEIKARYNQSVLGYAWTVIVPLLNLVVLSIVFSYFLRVPTQGVPYPIFLFVALVPWNFMVSAITASTSSIVANRALITKVKLPREIIPLSAIFSKIIDLVLTALVLIIFLFSYQVEVSSNLFFLPLIFLVHLALIIGVSFILSATNVFFRDIENILGIFLTIWMYLTPILYSLEVVPNNLKILVFLNPMTGIIIGYRNSILYQLPPDWGAFLYSTIISLSVFIIGKYYFQNRQKYFADVV